MRLMISFAALFLSVILLQLSTGGVGPLDALSGITLDFTNAQIGLLGSHPGACCGTLAPGTVSVATGVIGDPLMPAVRTGLDMSA